MDILLVLFEFWNQLNQSCWYDITVGRGYWHSKSHFKDYLRLVAEVSADLTNVLENSHIMFPTVIPELGGWELLLQHTSGTCNIQTSKINILTWNDVLRYVQLYYICWYMWHKDGRWTFSLLTGLSDTMNQMMHCCSEAVFTLCILQCFSFCLLWQCDESRMLISHWLWDHGPYFLLSLSTLPALNPCIQTLVHTSVLRTRTELLLPH